MPGKPEWTPDQVSTLRTMHAKGHSYQDIADVIGCNKRFIFYKAADYGLTPNNTINPKSIEAVKEGVAQRRMALANDVLADCENLRHRLWDEYDLIVIGPNGPERMTLDIPDAKAVSELSNAIHKLSTVHENLERIGKATTAEVQKSSINVLLENLAKVLEAEQ